MKRHKVTGCFHKFLEKAPAWYKEKTAKAESATSSVEVTLASLNPDGPCSIGDAMALVSGWTRGYGDVKEAATLAKAAPVAAVAGMIARELCESIGWTEGGLMSLMSLAQALQDDAFVALVRETVDNATKASSQTGKPEGESGNA